MYLFHKWIYAATNTYNFILYPKVNSSTPFHSFVQFFSAFFSPATKLYEQSADGIVNNSYETELQNLENQVNRLHKKVESLSERLRKIEN